MGPDDLKKIKVRLGFTVCVRKADFAGGRPFAKVTGGSEPVSLGFNGGKDVVKAFEERFGRAEHPVAEDLVQMTTCM